jgi:hypothetical protein
VVTFDIVNVALCCPGITDPFFRHTNVNGPLPEATVLKLAVAPAQTVKPLNDVAATLLLSTVTVNVHVLVFPLPSVAVLVTVVVPAGKE